MNNMEDRLAKGIGAIASRYGIDCFYIGDSIMPEIGLCSLYLPLDIREEYEKNKDNFNELLFKVDGSIIEGAQFNSILLTQHEVEAFARSIGLKLNLNAKGLKKMDLENGTIVYEAFAVNKANLDNFDYRLT